MFPEIPIEAAGAAIQPHVRKVDLLVKWGEGTAVFFPCLPPTESRRVFTRMSSELNFHNLRLISVEFKALADPISVTGAFNGQVAQ